MAHNDNGSRSDGIRMNIINRGIVGSWEGGSTKVFKAAMWLGLGLALIGLTVWGVINQIDGVASTGVLLTMWVLSAGDSGMTHLLSWVFDSEQIAV